MVPPDLSTPVDVVHALPPPMQIATARALPPSSSLSPTGSFLLLRRVRALTDDGLDDQVREKPTGLPKSRASVMGIKLKKSNEHMDRSSVGPAGRAVLVCPILRDTVAIRVVVPLIRLHGRRRVRLGLRWL
jgi:hypothetical protein